MKFVLLLLALCALASAKPQLYTTKYDDFDVDEVLNNRRLLVNYMNCVLDKGKCTKEGKELKRELHYFRIFCFYIMDKILKKCWTNVFMKKVICWTYIFCYYCSSMNIVWYFFCRIPPRCYKDRMHEMQWEAEGIRQEGPQAHLREGKGLLQTVGGKVRSRRNLQEEVCSRRQKRGNSCLDKTIKIV